MSMKFKYLIFATCLTFFSSYLHSEANLEKGILSLDLMADIRNFGIEGWKAGVSYEFNLYNFNSIKSSFIHKTYLPTSDTDWITTVGLNLDARIYPFMKGLNWLYFGYGIGTDFLMIGNNKSQTFISHCAHIGWKQNLFGYSMIEFYFGYRMKITDVDDIYFSKNIINNRFEYSISLKFNFKKIWQKISK